MGITYPHGSNPTITDNNGNIWPSTPTVSADAGVGGNVTSIFVLPNANSGQTSITVSFESAVIPFNYVVSEYRNIDTVSPVNGTTSAANLTGASLATGSFTPGNNDANGGNLIWNYYALATLASSNPTSWVSGSGFALLDADIAWTTNRGFPHASQSSVQTMAADINPSITATGDSVDAYNCVAVALQVASAGTAAPAGIHVDKIIHQTNNSPPASWVLQEPATGNLRVLTVTTPGWTNVTDNEGGTWTGITTEPAQIWYSSNKSPNPNLTITITIGSGEALTTSIRFFDISGAAASPFDVSAVLDPIDVSNQTTVNNAPSITPTTANGLVIAVLQIGNGPGLGFNTGAPAGAIFDLVTYTEETDDDLMENADGNAHVYNTNTSTENWNWQITSIANNSVTAVAAAFKSLKSVTATHDFDGDGKSDIAWRDTSGNTAVWLMNGAQVTQSAGIGAAPTVWSVVGQRDFDGDGKHDWLWSDINGNVAMWFLNGAQVTQSAEVGNFPTVWSIVGTGDFDGDGKGDILWRDTSGNVAIWLMNGAQVTQSAGVGNVPTVWSIQGANAD